MKKKLFTVALLCVYIILNIRPLANSSDGETKKTVYVFDIKQEISATTTRLVKKAFKEAEEAKADIIVIQMNTYGGQVIAADQIHSIIIHSKIPVYVWIDGNAASAGAFISISCDSIYMRKASIMGAASVVNQNGDILPDKYQSDMRGMMRATAEQQGRDPMIAEGMVTPNGYLKDIADTGRVITLTTQEAIRYNYCEGQAETLAEVLKLAKVNDYTLIEYQTTWVDMLIDLLTNPIVNSILLLVIMGGIYLEFQHPGIGFPLFAAIGAAVLYFAPLYMDGLAANWEILIFVVGVLLIILEIFIIPGFGVPGITGIILVVSGLTLALLNNNNFDFSFTGFDTAFLALLRIVLILAIGIVLAFVFGKHLIDAPVMKKIVLTDTMDAAKGYVDSPVILQGLLHQTGKAVTDLRPSGVVNINGEQYDAVGEGGYIHKEDRIKVTEIRGNYLVVRKAEA